MANRIIRPRRGVKSLWDLYKSRIYRLGEMLVESPETGVGTGPVNVKFGDGVTPYENLPYAIEAPTSQILEGSTKPITSGAVYEQSKWKLAGSASKNNTISLAGISYEEVLILVTNDSDGDGKAGWYDTSLVVPKIALINRQIINMPAYYNNAADRLYCVCWYGNEAICIYSHSVGDRGILDKSTLYVYYR